MCRTQDKRELLTPELRAQWNEILHAAAAGGWLRLAFLEIEGRKAAACVAFDFDRQLWVYDTGIEENFRGYSPGGVLFTCLLQWAIAQRRDQEFKAWFGARKRNIYCLRLLRAEAEMKMGEESPRYAGIDDDLLAAGLGAEAIVERGELPATSSADCEIVTCRMPDDARRRFFCKFGPAAEPSGSTQRYGVGYEAQVFEALLHAFPGDVPPLAGAFLDDASQTLVLSLDYLEGGTPLHQTAQPKPGMLAAARWIARFHTWGQSATVPEFLRRYDTEFYRNWLQRAADLTRGRHARYPWLPELCERAARRLPALLPPATIIHGEYQANNILVCDGRNVVTDWESAALAAGEIDLAGLTWGWDDDLISLCEQEYCLARWPDATPADFPLRLIAARVFLQLRWLGDPAEVTDADSVGHAIEELAPLAEKFAELDR